MTDIAADPDVTTDRSTGGRGMRFFTAADAPTLDDDGMMSPPDVPAEVLSTLDLTPLGAGSQTKVLFKDDVAGMSLVYARFLAGYRLPRHSHSADCLYYVISGEAQMGGRTVRAGDGFFVRSDQPYAYTAGPDGIEILEFRGATSFDMKIFDRTIERWNPIVDAAAEREADWKATWAAESG